MKKVILFLYTLLFIGACSTPSYLPKPSEINYHVKGHILEVWYDTETKTIGEIIEVNSDSITILPLESSINTITNISKAKIRKAKILVSLGTDKPKKMKIWAALLSLSSIGHGYFGVFTLPINLVSTLSIANSVNFLKYPKDISWEKMSKFARFPQGIPPNVDPFQIK